jgi:hypothetical protein
MSRPPQKSTFLFFTTVRFAAAAPSLAPLASLDSVTTAAVVPPQSCRHPRVSDLAATAVAHRLSSSVSLVSLSSVSSVSSVLLLLLSSLLSSVSSVCAADRAIRAAGVAFSCCVAASDSPRRHCCSASSVRFCCCWATARAPDSCRATPLVRAPAAPPARTPSAAKSAPPAQLAKCRGWATAACRARRAARRLRGGEQLGDGAARAEAARHAAGVDAVRDARNLAALRTLVLLFDVLVQRHRRREALAAQHAVALARLLAGGGDDGHRLGAIDAAAEHLDRRAGAAQRLAAHLAEWRRLAAVRLERVGDDLICIDHAARRERERQQTARRGGGGGGGGGGARGEARGIVVARRSRRCGAGGRAKAETRNERVGAVDVRNRSGLADGVGGELRRAGRLGGGRRRFGGQEGGRRGCASAKGERGRARLGAVAAKRSGE